MAALRKEVKSSTTLAKEQYWRERIRQELTPEFDALKFEIEHLKAQLEDAEEENEQMRDELEAKGRLGF